jgi:hypothetical protein
MLVLEIALGIILAWAAIAAAPIVVGLTLGAVSTRRADHFCLQQPALHASCCVWTNPRCVVAS